MVDKSSPNYIEPKAKPARSKGKPNLTPKARVLRAMSAGLFFGVVAFAGVGIGSYGLGVIFTKIMFLAVVGAILAFSFAVTIGVFIASLSLKNKQNKPNKLKVWTQVAQLREKPEPEPRSGLPALGATNNHHNPTLTPTPPSPQVPTEESEKPENDVKPCPINVSSYDSETPEYKGTIARNRDDGFEEDASLGFTAAQDNKPSAFALVNEQPIYKKVQAILKNNSRGEIESLISYFSSDTIYRLQFSQEEELMRAVQCNSAVSFVDDTEQACLINFVTGVLRTQIRDSSTELVLSNLQFLHQVLGAHQFACFLQLNAAENNCIPALLIARAYDAEQAPCVIELINIIFEACRTNRAQPPSISEIIVHVVMHALSANNHDLAQKLIEHYQDEQVSLLLSGIDGDDDSGQRVYEHARRHQAQCLLTLTNRQGEKLISLDKIAQAFISVITDPTDTDLELASLLYNHGLNTKEYNISFRTGKHADAMKAFETWLAAHPSMNVASASSTESLSILTTFSI